jgi:hypothetical protein
MKATAHDDLRKGSFYPHHSRDQITLTPYQRDVLRLVVRDLRRPEEIPESAWHDILFGEAIRISETHLDVLSKIDQDLYAALEFWELEDR